MNLEATTVFILPVLSLPTSGPEMCLHLFSSSLIYFISILQFSAYKFLLWISQGLFPKDVHVKAACGASGRNFRGLEASAGDSKLKCEPLGHFKNSYICFFIQKMSFSIFTNPLHPVTATWMDPAARGWCSGAGG